MTRIAMTESEIDRHCRAVALGGNRPLAEALRRAWTRAPRERRAMSEPQVNRETPTRGGASTIRSSGPFVTTSPARGAATRGGR